jgi:hypothetical protein
MPSMIADQLVGVAEQPARPARREVILADHCHDIEPANLATIDELADRLRTLKSDDLRVAHDTSSIRMIRESRNESGHEISARFLR